MAVRKCKPTSPGRRFRTIPDFAEITATTPCKALVEPHNRKGGRNFQGRITARRRGGGHKRRYRVIDFRRDKLGVPGKVATIEYDPNRSARIVLVHYADGEKRYILAPLGIEVGDEIVSSDSQVDPRPGSCMPIRYIPLGMPVHNIELHKGRGGQVVRSAGSAAYIAAKEGDYAHVTMPSGEMRLIRQDCLATVGQVGNPDHQLVSGGKAGRTRWLGRRPHVRGSAMNPVSHPMGGGEGRRSGGRHPVSPSGVLAKGGKTRARRNPSNRFIVRRRKK